MRAQERERLANGFIYDVELTDAEGRVRERWERLHLRAISGTDFKGPWPEGLLTPYVERCLLDLVPGASVSVAFERDRTPIRQPVAIAAHAQLRVRSATAGSSGAQMENQKLATDATCPPPTPAISRWLSPDTSPSVAISNSS